MDKTIRINKMCIIGLPRCDFVFSSTRACFTAYGFQESPLEMTIIRKLLEEREIHSVEASGSLAPAQNAFCAKICSKIITSQFCIVLLNNDIDGSREVPNANVNMEYGLMLGFNKYVIPFQRSSQKLPFNVAGLDTIKYTDQDLEKKAIDVLGQAIKSTNQENVPMDLNDQNLSIFLLNRSLLITALDSQGEKNLYRLGDTLGFNLLHDFSGVNYTYLGVFTTLRPESIVWRIQKLNQIINGRRGAIPTKEALGAFSKNEAELGERLFKTIKILIIVTSQGNKDKINTGLVENPIDYNTEIMSLDDVQAEVESDVPSDI